MTQAPEREPAAGGEVRAPTVAGQRVYVPLVLRVYDLWVLEISCRVVWRCPPSRIQSLYDRHARTVHLDVGVGTGRFLDRCAFPVERPRITLLDLNPNALAHTARRIARYRPHAVQADALRPIPLEERSFDSIASNFLLHCLPDGGEGGKWRVFDHLAPLLRDDGVLFGSTLLGAGLRRSPAQRALMALYQHLGVFANRRDAEAVLRTALEHRFREVAIGRCGVVALFAARGPRR